MIERLVFISTMVLFLMIGINGFIAMGNQLCMPDGSKLNLTGTDNLPCGTFPTSYGGDNNTYITQVSQITPGDLNTSGSTSAPGSASSVTNFFFGGISAAWLGISWLGQAALGAQFLAGKLIALFPFATPIILIPTAIATILEGFALMYWTMQGARALLGRFL